MRRRLPFILLAAVCALSFGLNARVAADPRNDYQSADERSYGKLAIDIADNRMYGSKQTKMKEPLHWPPGAPMLFAATYKLFGSEADHENYDIRAVYWTQALVTTGTTAMVFLLAWLLAGPWAGAVAGLIAATYAPLIGATGDQLSEPLGAFLLVSAFTVLALAVKRERRLWLYGAAGALFGLTILTRTDLLPVPFLIAGAMVFFALVRRREIKATTLRYGLVAVVAGVVLLPWTVYASREEGRFIPVTVGSASALFVGTYLPGGGTTMGMKTHIEDELRRRHPEYNGIKTYKIPAADALEIFAERHPDLTRDQALQKEARKNLIHYSTNEPVAFVQMQWAKAKRMWFFYYRGGGVHYISTPMRIWQVVLVILAGLGLLVGFVRTRHPLLGAVIIAIAFSTLIHTIVVSQARYNLPLMPTLIAAGVVGWFLALRRRPAAADAETATMPAWNSEESASGAPSATAPAT